MDACVPLNLPQRNKRAALYRKKHITKVEKVRAQTFSATSIIPLLVQDPDSERVFSDGRGVRVVQKLKRHVR